MRPLVIYEHNGALFLRKSEPSSVSRMMGFKRVGVNLFYDLLEKILNEHKIIPDRIFINIEERKCPTVNTKLLP